MVVDDTDVSTLSWLARVQARRGRFADAGAGAAAEALLPAVAAEAGPTHRATLELHSALATWRGEASDTLAAKEAFERLAADLASRPSGDARRAGQPSLLTAAAGTRLTPVVRVPEGPPTRRREGMRRFVFGIAQLVVVVGADL